MAPQITKVEVDHNSRISDYSLSWEHKGARYHVWLSGDGQFALRPTLYKNPPITVEHRGPGWFSTRRLDVSVTKNHLMIQEALLIAKQSHLFEAADAKLDAIEAEHVQKAVEATRLARIKDNAPELLEALKALTDLDPPCPFPPSDGRYKEWFALWERVVAAIAKAEGRQS